MRVTEAFDLLNSKISRGIRKDYPLVYNKNLTNSFDKLTLPENIEGNLAQIPYIEGLPQYKNLVNDNGESGIKNLIDEKWLGEKHTNFINFMEENKNAGFFDPYIHQAQALKGWANGSDIIVSTGTGSGKTECFLWPIAGHLHSIAERAKLNPDKHRGIKALILYPMNALVADQLKRLRQTFGREDVGKSLAQGSLIQGGKNRTFQFGQYTGRTKFHGSYARSGTKGGSLNQKVAKSKTQFENFIKIRNHTSTNPEIDDGLYNMMMDKGLIPAKGSEKTTKNSYFWDLNEYKEYSDPNIRKNAGLITRPGDRELYYRHEMHNTGYSNLKNKGKREITDENNGGGTPDILVTNYSMLEFMLKRPLEHGIFAETREWLEASPENKLLFVLDEAHLYQGALGTEIGLLVRRFLSSVGIYGDNYNDKVQFILTSASLGEDAESKKRFVHGLTGRPLKDVQKWEYLDIKDIDWNKTSDKSSLFIGGERWVPNLGNPSNEELLPIQKFLSSIEDYPPDRLDSFLKDKLVKSFDAPDNDMKFVSWFREEPLFRRLYSSLLEEALSLDDLSEKVLGNVPKKDLMRRRKCMESVLNLVASLRGKRPNSDRVLPMLGIRSHFLYRGLPTLHWNISKDSIELRGHNSADIVYPVRGCRRCGAPYISMWVKYDHAIKILNNIKYKVENKYRTFSRPFDHSVRLEVYLYERYEDDRGVVEVGNRKVISDGPAHVWINKESYNLTYSKNQPGENWLPGYLAAPVRKESGDLVEFVNIEPELDQTGRFGVQMLTFNRCSCLQCKTLHKNRRRENPQLTDYATRGDEIFSGLMNELIALQNPVKSKSHLPNKGKKAMIFSDSRSRAAKLALNIQDKTNYDELRHLVLHLLNQDWYQDIPDNIRTLEFIYPLFTLHCTHAKLEPFASTGNKDDNDRIHFAHNRINMIAQHAVGLHEYLDEIDQNEYKELVEVIKSTNTKLDIKNIALSFYDGFHRYANRTSDEFESYENKLNCTSHEQVVKKLRSELKTIILANIRKETKQEISEEDKKILLGVFFDINYWNEEINPDYNGMRFRLLELGMKFEKNPVDYLEYIITNKHDYLESKYTPEKLQSMCEMIREIIKKRVKETINDRKNPNRERFINASTYLQKNPLRLSELSILAEQIIKLTTNTSIMKKKKVISHWSEVCKNAFPYNSPKSFSTNILDFIGSRDFSFSALGLAHVIASDKLFTEIRSSMYDYDDEDDEEEIHKFKSIWNDNLKSIISELIHWMVRPFYGDRDSESGKKKNAGERCMASEDRGNYSFNRMRAHPSRKYFHSDDENTWGINYDKIKNKYDKISKMIYKGVDNPIPFTNVSNLILTKNTSEGAGMQYLVKSEVVELKILNEEDDIRACTRCAITIPIIDERTSPKICINCNYGLEAYDPTNEVIKQRIDSPWRGPAKKAWESSLEDLEIIIIRAEEHTAQINIEKDDDEIYTSAEEFELLFQDIPFVIPSADEAWTQVQAPIDILSCTTTMEVGIDIGSLTCVALRTVPRKSSNYQQRVGRAGRGSAEVCIALSWCDNQPHAQNYFENPAEMLTHPSNSPVIYLNNESIIKRHVNAAIFQSFFKRMRYDIYNRKFTEMQEGEIEVNLMESMGTLKSFFDDDDENNYTYEKFKNWLNGVYEPNEDEFYSWESTNDQIKDLIPKSSKFDIRDIINDLNKFLEDEKIKFEVMRE